MDKNQSSSNFSDSVPNTSNLTLSELLQSASSEKGENTAFVEEVPASADSDLLPSTSGRSSSIISTSRNTTPFEASNIYQTFPYKSSKYSEKFCKISFPESSRNYLSRDYSVQSINPKNCVFADLPTISPICSIKSNEDFLAETIAKVSNVSCLNTKTSRLDAGSAQSSDSSELASMPTCCVFHKEEFSSLTLDETCLNYPMDSNNKLNLRSEPISRSNISPMLFKSSSIPIWMDGNRRSRPTPIKPKARYACSLKTETIASESLNIIRTLSLNESTAKAHTSVSAVDDGRAVSSQCDLNARSSTLASTVHSTILDGSDMPVSANLLNYDGNLFSNPTAFYSNSSQEANWKAWKNFKFKWINSGIIGLSSEGPSSLTPIIPPDVLTILPVPIKVNAVEKTIPVNAKIWEPNDYVLDLSILNNYNQQLETIWEETQSLEETSSSGSSSSAEAHKPPNNVRRNKSYQERTARDEQKPTEQQINKSDLATTSNIGAFLIPKITIQNSNSTNSSPIIHPLPRGLTLPAPENVQKPLRNDECNEYESSSNEITEMLRASEHLGRTFRSGIQRGHVWLPLRRNFVSLRQEIVWIPVAKLMTKELMQNNFKIIGVWAQPKHSFRNHGSWLAAPSYVRKIVKTELSSIYWIAVSRQILVTSSVDISLNRFSVNRPQSTEREYVGLITPILANKITAEVRDGRLDKRWFKLLRSVMVSHLLTDYWKIRTTAADRR